MELKLIRDVFGKTWTQGKLYVDDTFVCYTLEDCDRFLESFGGVAKVAGQTAIPRGTYQVKITMSNRFGKDMPLLLDVPHFTGVRIHSGNSDADTDGCVLVGMDRLESGIITNSKGAFNMLFKIIDAEIKASEIVTIKVE